ncbi:MAG: glycosyltransferase [Lawsonibacter sp.]|jgi:GT2 family glycosyltransferase/SAM-dependent methyltransferase|nr:glycosyltransferase [Lawsonibacter sp.]
MVNENHGELLEQILALLDTACGASLELLERHTGGGREEAGRLLEDLSAVTGAVRKAQEPLLPQLEHAYTTEMLENTADALERIGSAIRSGDSERAAFHMEFQLFPYLRQLREAFYYWGAVYPDKERMDRYYREEFARNYQNYYTSGGNPPQYRATVVVVAYNHLEMTKQCVESVLEHTDFEALNAQLILVDHGSTDGVGEYFEGLGVGRVIHYKANMRGTMFCVLPQICDSEYYVHVANDTVATKDWLDIMLRCADSDANIAAVVPATCNMSNYQQVNVPVSDCGALVKLAEKHNRSNPRLWSDRARVLPAIGLFRLQALNEIGFWDPLFYTFDFMDDDFSLRARRRGYRQVLCEDVMCYHRGSATVKAVQGKEDTLGQGRRLFLQKHGVDPWGDGFCYDFQGVQQYQFTSAQTGRANILGIDCGFGDTAMQIRNWFRRMGREGSVYHATTQACYLPDLEPQSEGAVCVPPAGLLSALGDSFPNVQFDAVFLGRGLEGCPDPYGLLEAIARRMAPGGQLVFFFANPYFAVRLSQMLQFSIPDSPARLLRPEQVKEEAAKLFASVDFSGAIQPIQGLDEFVVRHYGKEFLKSGQKKRLEVEKYYVRCVK